MSKYTSTLLSVFFILTGKGNKYVTILGYSVEDWIALATFLGGIIFGLMKFHTLFMRMDRTLNDLNDTVKQIEGRFSEHDTRLTRLEEQNKTIFKRMEKMKND